MKFSVRVLSLFVLVVGLYGCATNQARISTPIEGRLLSLHGMVITGSVTVDSLKEQGATCRNSLGNWQVTCVSDLDGQTKASYIFSYNKLSQVNVMFMNGGVASYGEALSSLGLTVTKPDVMSSELRAVCNNVPTVKKSPQCTTLKWTQKYLGVKEIMMKRVMGSQAITDVSFKLFMNPKGYKNDHEQLFKDFVLIDPDYTLDLNQVSSLTTGISKKDPNAQFAAGMSMLMGTRGFEKSEGTGVKFLIAAADQKHVQASTMLGTLLEIGDKVYTEENKIALRKEFGGILPAEAYLKHAVSKKDPRAMGVLAMAYATKPHNYGNGKKTKADIFSMMLDAARLGDEIAARYVALSYWQGEEFGVKRNPQKALSWAAVAPLSVHILNIKMKAREELSLDEWRKGMEDGMGLFMTSQLYKNPFYRRSKGLEW